MRIGQLAKETGVTVQAIRFYERRGLLKNPARLGSGYRSYSADAVQRIRFIKRSQELGYTLVEIARLLEIKETLPQDTARARSIIEIKIRDIGDRIRDLQHMRDELTRIALACGCGDARPVCRVLERLEYPVEPPSETRSSEPPAALDQR
ncbi:MAG TPA: heavy metal-responsive transcriptional regulator [Blastocatellia bacterium]|nr:heavy metal-responsive transcriptional regulator [Blastocatellia bacterium]